MGGSKAVCSVYEPFVQSDVSEMAEEGSESGRLSVIVSASRR